MARKRGFFAELEHQRRQRELAERRFQAEQKRLAEQAVRERQRAEQAAKRAEAQAVREQRAQRVEDQQNLAVELTAKVKARVAELDSILIGPRLPASSFDQLRQTYKPTPFDPGRLAIPEPPPQWEQFAPAPPTVLARVLRKSSHDRATKDAQERFAEAKAKHEHDENRRLARIAEAKSKHAQAEASMRQEVDQNNAQVDQLERDVKAGVPQAVEDYFELLLEASPQPDDLPADVETAYQADARKLLIVRDLPGLDVIPETREYTYVRTRDEVTSKPRPVKEIKQRYGNLVAQVVLRTMRDAFDIHPIGIVDEVAINGHVSTRNKATGKPERPCLVSVSATREQFAEFELDELDPTECLRHLNALVSPHPWDLEAVRPIFDPDLSKYRLVDAHDAAAGLDSRPVLLEMRPFEFEVLVKQLFEAMGMKSWVTQASRDDGVDAVAVNEDPIMGGVCVIQAKRYRSVVPVDAVRALAGVMDDKRASRGVLVTTSWFGKATEDFVGRHGRIQLIAGPELKHLLAEHLDLDVVIGALKGR
ncbi:restriction endonuclease [Kibdelosporangium aridum]|uniref:Restriction endonuclease n=1 Tax=Kibdelosporangium aridum TaxID=2030 RepID=A0A428YJL9_KIBAR|nr:restriction endonuclease [Kibdelosporangium aridum]RSM67748.1 restriction endonuclease [Kibdelosporangium aridum]